MSHGRQQLIDSLKTTMDDYRISRGEKRSLSRLFEDLSEHDLQVVTTHAFELARNATVDPETSQVIDWLEDVMKTLHRKPDRAPSPASEALFSAKDDCSRRICTLLDLAQRSADICVFTITDNRIYDALVSAYRRNVALRIISDYEKSADLGSDIERLIRLGVPVRLDRTPSHMHHKYAIFDARRLITGSYNWTRSASLSNEENLIVCSDRQLIDPFQQHFDKLWNQYG